VPRGVGEFRRDGGQPGAAVPVGDDLRGKVDVRLPVNFTAAHRAAVLRFVQGRWMSDAQHATQFEAFDMLHRATVGNDTFATFYERVVEEPCADSFIGAL